MSLPGCKSSKISEGKVVPIKPFGFRVSGFERRNQFSGPLSGSCLLVHFISNMLVCGDPKSLAQHTIPIVSKPPSVSIGELVDGLEPVLFPKASSMLGFSFSCLTAWGASCFERWCADGVGARERKGKEGNRRDRTGKEGKGRERKGKDGKGRERKGKKWKEREKGKGRERKGQERKGRERKGKEGKGRERKGKKGKERERKGKDGKGRERKGKEGKGRERKGKEGKGRERKGKEGKGRERGCTDGCGRRGPRRGWKWVGTRSRWG